MFIPILTRVLAFRYLTIKFLLPSSIIDLFLYQTTFVFLLHFIFAVLYFTIKWKFYFHLTMLVFEFCNLCSTIEIFVKCYSEFQSTYNLYNTFIVKLIS